MSIRQLNCLNIAIINGRSVLTASVIFALMVVALPVYSFDDEEDDYYSNWVFKHNNYTLTWYYNTKRDFESNHPNRVKVQDKMFQMRPDVRPVTINGIYLLEYAKVNVGEDVLDIGTGSGIHAVFAAEKANHVVATDIYPPAVENAKTNAKLHGVEDRIDFRVGDLFEPIHEDEKFDVFFININFPFNVNDNVRINFHNRLFSEIANYMKPDARIYFQTSFIKNISEIYEMLSRHRFKIMEVHMEHLYPSEHEPVFMMVKQR